MGASQVALVVKNPPANAGNVREAGSILGGKDSLEDGMATHSSILAWRFHGQRSLVGYSPWNQQRVRHDCVTNVRAHARARTHTHTREVT